MCWFLFPGNDGIISVDKIASSELSVLISRCMCVGVGGGRVMSWIHFLGNNGITSVDKIAGNTVIHLKR